eukprot:2131533-Prymnesium_polylepis.1
MSEPDTDALMQMDREALAGQDKAALVEFAWQLKSTMSELRAEYKKLLSANTHLREKTQSLMDMAEHLSRRRPEATPSPHRPVDNAKKPEEIQQVLVGKRRELQKATEAVQQLDSFVAFEDVLLFKTKRCQSDDRNFCR